MPLKIGDRAQRSKVITEDDVRLFAQTSGDTNSVHLDAAYAATTIFKRPIAHGMLTASVIGAVLGCDLPRLGTIYLSQSLKFKAPVYIGDTITAAVELTAYRKDKRIATFRTTVANQDGALVVEGEAVVIAPEGA